jgi:hypothetical protein
VPRVNEDSRVLPDTKLSQSPRWWYTHCDNCGQDMTVKATAVFLATMLAAPLGVASQGIASGKGKDKSSHHDASSKLYAKFDPACGTLPDEFKARVKYEKKSNSKGTEEEIDAKVRLALPPETLLDPLVDTTGYLVRVLSGTPSTTCGTPPAVTAEKGVCVLLAKAIELEYESGVLSEFDFKYAAKVKEKTPISGPPSTIKSRVGDCWVNSTTKGVPDVLTGDIVELYSLTLTTPLPLTSPPTFTAPPLLTGSFQPGYDHGDDEDDDD